MRDNGFNVTHSYVQDEPIGVAWCKHGRIMEEFAITPDNARTIADELITAADAIDTNVADKFDRIIEGSGYRVNHVVTNDDGSYSVVVTGEDNK